jgi:hypothetical protein
LRLSRDGIWQDIRYGLRGRLKHPALAGSAVVGAWAFWRCVDAGEFELRTSAPTTGPDTEERGCWVNPWQLERVSNPTAGARCREPANRAPSTHVASPQRTSVVRGRINR